MLVIAHAETGELVKIDDLDKCNINIDFTFELKKYSNVDEYIQLTEKIEHIYIQLRDSYMLYKILDKELLKKYSELVTAIVPAEIIENVYKLFSIDLFSDC